MGSPLSGLLAEDLFQIYFRSLISGLLAICLERFLYSWKSAFEHQNLDFLLVFFL